MKLLKNFILAGSFALATFFSSPAKASDVLIGVRGPTSFQADERVSYSKNEKSLETLADNLILKYWTGDKLGFWSFVNLSYKHLVSPGSSNQGLGDTTWGLGPRGRINNLHWLLYGALTFPTGDSGGKPALGNGRYDPKLGLFLTYLTPNKKTEIDGLLEYNFTGKDGKGSNPPGELSAGLLVGGEMAKGLRLAAGVTSLVRTNADYLLNLRAVMRYTFSPKLHLELLGDVGISSKNIPKSSGISVFGRYNF